MRFGMKALLTKLGSQGAIADALGVKPSAVSQWFSSGCIPLDRAIEIEEKWDIPRSTLIDPKLIEKVIGIGSSK